MVKFGITDIHKSKKIVDNERLLAMDFRREQQTFLFA